MNLKSGLTAAAIAAMVAGSCLGQTTTTLYVVKVENFDLLSRAEISAGVPNPDNTFWIGHNPTCIAYGQGRLFIAGLLNGAVLPLDGADADGDTDTSEVTPFNISVVKVNNILTTRSFSTIPGSRTSVSTNSLGYTGLDYAPNEGATVRGLIAAYDPNGAGVNQVSRYNVDVPGNGVIVAPVPPLVTGFRLGSSGPAWDFGPAGLGVDYLPNMAIDGVPDGPVVAAIDFGNRGPYGLDPDTLNGGFGQTRYEIGLNNGPRLAPDGEGQTLWRDLAIDRRNGNIAARANNNVIFAARNANGTATRVDMAPGDPATERIITTTVDFVPQHRIAIMAGYDDAGVGDLLVWNDRPVTGAGQAFETVVRFNKTVRTPASDTGAFVTATYLNADGSPAVFPTGVGVYDFAWDNTTRVLFVSDFANRNVYLLSPEAPRSCCLPSGNCFVLNPSACASAEVGGVAGALGSICSPNPCAQPTIACCFGDGSCQSLTADACTSGGGIAEPAGSVCSPSPCTVATGACCNGTTCTITTAGACTGTFRGAGTVCEFVGNPVTCCRANFNQVGGVTVQDIFDFLAAYFGNNPAADINGSGSVTVQDIFDFLSLYFVGCAA